MTTIVNNAIEVIDTKSTNYSVSNMSWLLIRELESESTMPCLNTDSSYHMQSKVDYIGYKDWQTELEVGSLSDTPNVVTVSKLELISVDGTDAARYRREDMHCRLLSSCLMQCNEIRGFDLSGHVYLGPCSRTLSRPWQTDMESTTRDPIDEALGRTWIAATGELINQFEYAEMNFHGLWHMITCFFIGDNMNPWVGSMESEEFSWPWVCHMAECHFPAHFTESLHRYRWWQHYFKTGLLYTLLDTGMNQPGTHVS